MIRNIFRNTARVTESTTTRRTSRRFVPSVGDAALEGRISLTTMGGVDVTITVTNEPTPPATTAGPTQAIVFVTDPANMPGNPTVRV
jgi:hypothetical protein